MEFLHSFLRRHLAGKPVVVSPNVGCFHRLREFFWFYFLLFPMKVARVILIVVEGNLYPTDLDDSHVIIPASHLILVM